jgi:hypothetical protein
MLSVRWCFQGLSGAASVAVVLSLSLFGTSPVEARPAPGSPETFGRGPNPVYANQEPNIFTHNVGLLTLQITNLGVLGNRYAETSAGWRGGDYLYEAGLWIGAIGEDAEPHVSSSTSVREFRPSILPIDTIYESFEGVSGGNRPGFNSGDDDGDGLFDEDFHNGKDDDGDGEIDEDYAAIGQQMFSCEYRDNTPEAANQISDHRPLGILIQQRSFQWATPGINEFVGFDFQVVNIGDQRLRDIYIGFNVDADAGIKSVPLYWTDDLVGYVRVDSDTLEGEGPGGGGTCARRPVTVDIAYIWDAPDNGSTIGGGDVPGYFGGMFLGHTTDATGVRAPKRVGLTTVKWTVSGGTYTQGDPRTDFERYDLLSSGEIPRRPANKPDDWRFTLAAGPFLELEPGGRLSFQSAFVIGEGLAGMLGNAVSAQRIFNGQYVDADKDKGVGPEVDGMATEGTGVGGRERCLRSLDGSEIFWDDPCDTLMVSVSRGKRTTCTWVDDDCDPCTGVDGKEFLLNWVGTTAPPPPAMNTDPELQADRIANPNAGLEPYALSPSGDRRVLLQWDNISELRPDPLTGKNLFEGYRIWRVDNWQRPEGSIGPTHDEWMMLAEFRLTPRDGLGRTSPRHLRAVTRLDRTTPKEILEVGDGVFLPHYPIGRYEWEDTNGVTNGKIHFYGITAFGIDTLENADTGEIEIVELGGSPAAVQRELVMTSWAFGGSCDDVKVVPNPYRGGADWDVDPSGCDPTGTKVAFRNLPEGWNKLSIFTLTGDLVLAAGPGDSRIVGGCEVSEGNRGGGTFYWDLVSRSGQDIVAGVYLWVVEAGGNMCRGRFVIIR